MCIRDRGVTAFDVCEGDLTDAVVVGGDTVDVNTPDDYIVTYNVSDSASNAAVEVTRTVTVTDSIEPQVIGVVVEDGHNVLVSFNKEMSADALLAATYTVSGTGAGSLSANPINVALDSGNTYRLTWACPDLMLNGGDITITVASTLEDTSGNSMMAGGESDTDAGGAVAAAPVITLIGDANIVLQLNDPFTDDGATAEDACVSDISGDIVVGGDTVDTSTAGTYVITYNVTDAAGNAAAEVTRTVVVTDAGAPLAVEPLPTLTLAEGATATWSATVSGGTQPYNFAWYRDDGTKAWQPIVDGPFDAGVYAGSDTNTLSFEPFTAAMAGQYKVEVSDSAAEPDLVEGFGEVVLDVDDGIPAAGGIGLVALALAAALGGVAALRRRK